MTISRLDRVSVFGDKLSFLIPHEWVQDGDQSQGVYLYRAPGTSSGWLRVSLITAKNSFAGARNLLAERTRQRNGKLRQSGLNLVATWENLSQEDGVPIYHYWWAVLHSLGPEVIRKRSFLIPSLQTTGTMRKRKTLYPFYLSFFATQNFLIP